MIVKKLKYCTLVLLCTIGLTGCPSLYYSHVPDPFDSNHENQLTDNANYATKLQDMIDKDFASHAQVKVVVNHFNVLLVGEVDSQDTQTNINALIKKQIDTKELWDYTQIAAKPSLKINSSLEKKVKERLSNEQDITTDDMSIVVVDGVVYILGGNVGDITHLHYAIRGIYTIDGVSGVVNLVKPTKNDFSETAPAKTL